MLAGKKWNVKDVKTGENNFENTLILTCVTVIPWQPGTKDSTSI